VNIAELSSNSADADYTEILATELSWWNGSSRIVTPLSRLWDFYRTPPLPRAFTIVIFAGSGSNMGGERSFCHNVEEWDAFREQLKQMPCPHCKVVGMLNCHGSLRGYDCGGKTERGRRVFCSNRNARRGCGRTFSVWFADKIRRLSVTAGCLWKFLQRAASGGVAAAIRAVQCSLSDRTWQRHWKRFVQAQSNIRTALCGRCPPPELPPMSPADTSKRPTAHVLAHLQAAFPNASCPIAAFQCAMRTFFV